MSYSKEVYHDSLSRHVLPIILRPWNGMQDMEKIQHSHVMHVARTSYARWCAFLCTNVKFSCSLIDRSGSTWNRKFDGIIKSPNATKKQGDNSHESDLPRFRCILASAIDWLRFICGGAAHAAMRHSKWDMSNHNCTQFVSTAIFNVLQIYYILLHPNKSQINTPLPVARESTLHYAIF